MITWTEWIGAKEPNDTLSLPINKHQYEAIQLDAIKHGMTIAADMANTIAISKRKECEEEKDYLEKLSLCGEAIGVGKSCLAILTTLNNLKEI